MSTRNLERETAAANALREVLRTITDDDVAIRDSIEGSTGLHEAIAGVLASITEDEMLATGIAIMVKSLSERKARIEYRIERQRAAIERGMVVGELQKLELPGATISLRKVAPSLEVIDEAQIPAQFFTLPPPKLDRKALSEALKAGEQVHGAMMNNGSIGLTIRRA